MTRLRTLRKCLTNIIEFEASKKIGKPKASSHIIFYTNTMTYNITNNNLHIQDSCYVYKKDMGFILDHIHSNNANSDVWRRSNKSLINEWYVHNALYNLHLFRSHTKDVDLNFPNKFEFAYNILAPFASLLIK